MLHLNAAIIPDPEKPVVRDAYGGEFKVELVVLAVPGEGRVIDLAFRGAPCAVRWDDFPAFLASAGLLPRGRLEPAELKPRPEDFDLEAALRDLGPRLRALREQTGIRLGELARRLHCTTSDLSNFELGEAPVERKPTTSDLELDAALHPAGRCTCGGGGGGDCEWCKMDQERHRVAARAFAGRLAEVAIHALVVDANFPPAILGARAQPAIAAALEKHVGYDDREVNRAVLADRLADAIDKALYDAHHPHWPNQGTRNVVRAALVAALEVQS